MQFGPVESGRTSRLEGQRLRALVGNLDLGVLVEDEARRVSLVNEAFCAMFSIERAASELIGSDCANAAQRAAQLVRDADTFLECIARRLREGVAVSGDEILFRDGRIVERDYAPVVVESVAQGHLWIYRDVTLARKHASLERAALVRDELRVAIDTIPGLVWSARADGYVDFLNQRWCDYTGLDLRQASGAGWKQAIHPDDLPGLLACWESMIESRAQGEHEARLRRHDGVYRWFLFRALPRLDAAGNVVKWYGQTTDIDDRRRAEAVLAAEKRLLEKLAHGASLDDVLETLCRTVEEHAPHCRCSVLLVDPFLSHVTHIFASSLSSRFRLAFERAPLTPDAGPCAASIHCREPTVSADVASDPRWQPSWRELILSEGLRSCWSAPIVAADARPLGSFALYSEQPGEPSAIERELIEQFTHLASVVVERKRAEAALQHAQAELSHLTRVTTLGELAASIAHEISQPLSAMVADASACQNWLRGEKPELERVRESLAAVVSDGARAAEVLNRIRALLSRSTLEHTRCDLKQILHGALELVRPELTRQGVRLMSSFDHDGQFVQGDAVELQQVILNLVLNASEATRGLEPERRNVMVRSAFTVIDARPFVQVSVEDAGSGIDANDLERIFSAFYSTKPGGLGMGLSISRSIVERHSGRLWARANPGFGATFLFAVPVSDVSSR